MLSELEIRLECTALRRSPFRGTSRLYFGFAVLMDAALGGVAQAIRARSRRIALCVIAIFLVLCLP
jgi:hypothetical protein